MAVTRRAILKTAAFAPAAAVASEEHPRRSPNDRIQAGVIGCGARSQELMQALLALPGVEISSISDAYQGRIERTLERTGKRPKVRRDYREILADPSIDAVVIATPDHWHRTMVVEAVNSGKDVYCEKPLTYRTSDGAAIIDAVRTHKRIVQVGSQDMSSAVALKAKEYIRSGKLGQITFIRAAYNRNTASGAWIYPIPPDASPETVNWGAFLGPAPKRPFDLQRFFRWRCFRDYSGGIATDLFVHLCTTIHYLMDAKAPARVVAAGELYRWKDRDVPDTLNAILEYPEGFTVTLSSTFNNQSGTEQGLQILGTEGSLILGGGLTFRAENVIEDNRWIVESWPSRLEQAYYRNPSVRAAEVPSAWPDKAIGSAEQYKEQGRDTTEVHMSHWLDSIRTREPYWEDATAGHRAAACAHMINQSARERRTLEWDFARDDVKV